MRFLKRRIPASVRQRMLRFLESNDVVRASAPPSPAFGAFHQAGELSTLHETRAAIAAAFLHGDGIEIGALHQPLQAPASARVRYVDRMPTAQLRLQYPELGPLPLVEPDIIDNGETLATLAEASQDFVIGNHFLEHCQDPIRTIQNLFRVLRPGGVLFMAVPDKRYSFDADRPCTTLAHLERDYAEGPAWSKHGHFDEWSRLVNKRTDPALVEEEIRHLINIDYSIHFHVWGAAELVDFLQALRRYVEYEMELFLRNGSENICVLRKR